MSECFAKIAFLRFLRYLSWVFLARKKNPCYFCDICGNFGALLGFFFFKVLILVRFVILAIFAIFVTGVFSSQQKSLLILRYLRTFRGPSWFLLPLNLEFCYICYFCDFCDICSGWSQVARKILIIFAMFWIFADISGSFLASFF